MDFKDLQERALKVREKYNELEIKKYGKAWTNAQLMDGFVGDVGDLMKIVMAKEGTRDLENVDAKLAHELADCLWSILVLAKKYDVDLETSFVQTMAKLEERIDKENIS